jgi:nucleotide-binding universal stress UspA family protein
MRILVPLDGSQTAEGAIPIALRLARQPKTSLVLLAVAETGAGREPAPAGPELASIREAQSYLETAKAHLTPDTEGVNTTVWSGPAAVAIIEAARTCNADMIVMTTHGRTGRERDTLGSVADAVLRGAGMPVLVLRPRREAIRRLAAPAPAAVSPGR